MLWLIHPRISCAKSSIPLANQNFAEVDQKSILEELHNHLLQRYKLLSRVILARKIHYSRFLSLSLDYGHQYFLDNLQNQKYIVLRALERLNHRTAELSFQNRAWFSSLHKCQDDEETLRDKEVKKVKRDASTWFWDWPPVGRRCRDKTSLILQTATCSCHVTACCFAS